MKLYRIMNRIEESGCYSPGFYHPDKEHLIESLKVLLTQYPENKDEFYIEETEIELTRIDLGAQDETEPSQSTEVGEQDQQPPVLAQPQADSPSTN